MKLSIVMNNTFFPPNLLLDPDNPCSDPPESIYVNKANSGT